MIKYTLACKKCDSTFSSWFLSSTDFDKLKKKNLLSCLKCNSNQIEKSIMSPNISSFEKLEKKSNLDNDIRKEMIKYQKYIKENCIDVGENFAYEARKVYYNNKKSKAIYGKATKEEISELEEEGIETLTVPWLKKIEN